MNKYTTLIITAILPLALFLSACSSDNNENTKKSIDKTTKSDSSKTSNNKSLPDPCTIVDFSDIQAVMNQTLTSERGEKGKYYDGGSTKYCSWEAKDLPFSSFEIRLGKEGEGSNNLDTAKQVGGPEAFEIELGDRGIVGPKLQVISFTNKGVFYDVQAVQNEKDFSGFSDVPPELKISGSSLAGKSIQSNLIAEYLIAKKIIENQK